MHILKTLMARVHWFCKPSLPLWGFFRVSFPSAVNGTLEIRAVSFVKANVFEFFVMCHVSPSVSQSFCQDAKGLWNPLS